MCNFVKKNFVYSTWQSMCMPHTHVTCVACLVKVESACTVHFLQAVLSWFENTGHAYRTWLLLIAILIPTSMTQKRYRRRKLQLEYSSTVLQCQFATQFIYGTIGTVERLIANSRENSDINLVVRLLPITAFKIAVIGSKRPSRPRSYQLYAASALTE